MRGLTLLLVAAALAVALGVPADRITRESAACDYVYAYDTYRVLCMDTFIHIDSVFGDGSANCNGSLGTIYTVTMGTTCGGSNGGCAPTQTTQVVGNNLSGNYRVAFIDGQGCVSLCLCQ